jgi:hypothetical protein
LNTIDWDSDDLHQFMTERHFSAKMEYNADQEADDVERLTGLKSCLSVAAITKKIKTLQRSDDLDLVLLHYLYEICPGAFPTADAKDIHERLRGHLQPATHKPYDFKEHSKFLCVCCGGKKPIKNICNGNQTFSYCKECCDEAAAETLGRK